MKESIKRKIKPASLIICAVTMLLSGLFISVQFLNHSIQKELVGNIQEALSDGILNSLRFSIISSDHVLIKKQVDNLLQKKSIYALEVRNKDGQILYRKEKALHRNVTINTKKYDVYLPFDGIEIDDLSDSNDESQILVGFIKIYFSTGHIDSRIRNHFIYTTLLLALAMLFVIAVFINFKNKKEKELKEHLTNTISLKNKAEEAEEFKDDFIKSISNEIRSPVKTIVELLENIHHDAEKRKNMNFSSRLFEACYHSSKRLQLVTEELFHFDQFQQENLYNNKEMTNISMLFDSFYNMYISIFNEKGISFTLDHEGNMHKDEFAYFDYKKLSRVIKNILENSLKFTEKGAVTLSWSIDKNTLRVSIRDTGVGICEGKIETIFKKHVQLKGPNEKSYQGRGLGLYYAKRLLEVINASIHVESKLGLGSEFIISIPIELVTSLTDDLPFNMKDFTAVVIDSEEDVCSALQELLIKYELQCDVDAIPEQGLCRVIQNPPDLVFIDYDTLRLKQEKIRSKITLSPQLASTIFVCMIDSEEEMPIIRDDDIYKAIIQKKRFSSIQIHTVLNDIWRSKEETKKIIGKFSKQENKN